MENVLRFSACGELLAALLSFSAACLAAEGRTFSVAHLAS